jgi:hypothetical protein
MSLKLLSNGLIGETWESDKNVAGYLLVTINMSALKMTT